jgi:hypothetical protein
MKTGLFKRLHIITRGSKQACPIIMPVHHSLNPAKGASSITVNTGAQLFIPAVEILYKLPKF